MYCSSCAKEVGTGLTFCNHCGVRLSGTKSETNKSELSSNALISAIVSVFVIGFMCIVAMLALMKNLGFNDEMIGIVITFSFVTIIFIEVMFMWLLFKRNRSYKEISDTTPIKEKPIKEIYTAPVRVLSEPTFQPVPSVTEHTTRTLEHVSKNNQ